jgi:hypothetical protein
MNLAPFFLPYYPLARRLRQQNAASGAGSLLGCIAPIAPLNSG